MAVSAIRSHHGEDAAFDYIVNEKLMNFAEAAEGRPEFARELPRFVAAIRAEFPPDTMRSELQRLAGYRAQDEADTAEALRRKQGAAPRVASGEDPRNDEDDFDDEESLGRRVRALAARRGRFEFLRELLLSERLGTA